MVKNHIFSVIIVKQICIPNVIFYKLQRIFLHLSPALNNLGECRGTFFLPLSSFILNEEK